MLALRVLFLAAVLAGATAGLHDRWKEVGRALAATSPAALLVGLASVLLGLIATALAWRLILRGYGYKLPVVTCAAVFFVGQLGKYIPGSVWSIGVQGRMARVQGVQVRSTVGTSLMFLGVHVVTALISGGVLALSVGLSVPAPEWFVWVVLTASLIGLAPPVLNALGTLVGGRKRQLALSWLDATILLLLMMVAWSLYAVALAVLLPVPTWPKTTAAAGAFALAYAAGVVVVFAPAGLGAREGTFVLLLAPVTGFAVAVSVALLARLLHTLADFVVAGVAWAALAARKTSAIAEQSG